MTHEHMVSTITLVLVCLIYYGAICIEIGHMLYYVVHTNLDHFGLFISHTLLKNMFNFR